MSGVLGFIDCQAQNIGAGGYQALASSGSAAGLVVTGLLTLFVALFGIRLLLGQSLELRDGVVAVAKIGVVLLIASSWPAFRTLFYDLTMHGPAEVVSLVGGPSGLPGAGGGLTSRLQSADDAVVALGQLGTRPDRVVQTAVEPGQPAVSPPIKVGLADDLSFGLARIAFLSGTLGTLAIVRLMSGLLLALAPLFAGLLLFDATRSLFTGWLRALVGATIAAVALTIVLGVELALLEPWLSNALARRVGDEYIYAAPTELLAMTLAFAVALFGVLAYALRMAFTVQVSIAERVGTSLQARPRDRDAPAPQFEGSAIAVSPNRAFAVADAVATLQRREALSAASSAAGSGGVYSSRYSTTVEALNGRAPQNAVAQGRLGQGNRRTRTRVSSGAAKRDRGA